MPRPLSELLSDIEGVLVPARRATYDANLEAATRLAALLPLVHRTGHPSQPLTWQNILRTGELRMSDVTDVRGQCTSFWGAPRFPKGTLAFYSIVPSWRQHLVVSVLLTVVRSAEALSCRSTTWHGLPTTARFVWIETVPMLPACKPSLVRMWRLISTSPPRMSRGHKGQSLILTYTIGCAARPEIGAPGQ